MRRRPQTTRSLRFSFLLGFSVGLLVGCQTKSDAQVLADDFVDAYYVEFDFDRAEQFTDGAATRRLERERELVREARATQQVEPRKSRVYYARPEVRAVTDELAHFTYALDVRQGDFRFSQSVVVMAAKKSGAWRVIEFREVRADLGDRPSPPTEPGQSGVRTTTTAP